MLANLKQHQRHSKRHRATAGGRPRLQGPKPAVGWARSAPVALLLLLVLHSSSTAPTLQQLDPRQGAAAAAFAALQSHSSCRDLKFVGRDEWGAKGPRASEADYEAQQSFVRVPSRVFVHQAWDGRTCADLDSCSVRLQAIQAYHQYTKNWPDIGYNLLISGEGTVYEGVGLQQSGFHTLHYNHESLGIALIGTFHELEPTPAMEAALEALLHCAAETGYLAPDYTLHGHRDARCTICPGDAAYARLADLAHFQPGPLTRYSCPTGSPAAMDRAALQSGARESALGPPVAPTATNQTSSAGLQMEPRHGASAEDQSQPKLAMQRPTTDDQIGAETSAVTTPKTSIAANAPKETQVALLRRRHEQRVARASSWRESGELTAAHSSAHFARPQKMELNKGPSQQLVVVNLQQPSSSSSNGGGGTSGGSGSDSRDGGGQSSGVQPMFYVLTKSKPVVAGPTLFYAAGSGPGVGGSRGGSGGGNTGGNRGSSGNSNGGSGQGDDSGALSGGGSGGSSGSGGSLGSATPGSGGLNAGGGSSGGSSGGLGGPGGSSGGSSGGSRGGGSFGSSRGQSGGDGGGGASGSGSGSGMSSEMVARGPNGGLWVASGGSLLDGALGWP